MIHPAIDLDPRALVPACVAGLIAAVIATVYAISFAALVFAGELSAHLATGIGGALFSAVILGTTMSLLSSYPGSVGVPQDIPAITLGLSTAAIASTLGGRVGADEMLATVLLAVALSTFAMGAVFFAFGSFRVGRLIRFIPYPVIGGILAGIGWFSIRGAFTVMTGKPLGLDNLAYLAEAAVAEKWLPGVAFGLVVWAVRRRLNHFTTIPAMIFLGILGFYVWLGASGRTTEAARAAGWLIGPFPAGGLWTPVDFAGFLALDWSLVASQSIHLATMIAASLMMVLLYAGGLEIAVRRDLDFNRELKAVGVANMLAGLVGGLPGFHSMSLSVLTDRLGAPVRLVGLVSAGLCGLALVFGSGLVTYFPKPVLGGLLVFLGFAMLVEWVGEGWTRLTKDDYAVVLLILVVSATFGYLYGVLVGLVAGTVIFVIKYSRINIVKNALSGAHLRSNVERGESLSGTLREHGDRIFVLKLQGFIFFGTAYRLIQQVKERLDDGQRPRLGYAILDFQLVNGIDSSVAVGFAKLAQYADDRGFEVCLSTLPDHLFKLLALEGIREERSREHRAAAARKVGGMVGVRIFPDLDRALEWCEDDLLAAGGRHLAGAADRLPEQLARAFPPGTRVADFMRYVDSVTFPAGAVLIEQGAESEDAFFIEEGEVSVELRTAAGKTVRLRQMGAGTAVGEIAFYLGLRRSASVTAIRPTKAFRLTRQALRQMATQHPDVAAAFHEFMAKHLSQRLLDSNRLIEALS